MSASSTDIDGPGLQLIRIKPRTLKQSIFQYGCWEYRELVALRRERFSDELLNRKLGSHRSKRRQGADESTVDDDVYWLGVMSSVLEQIDNKVHCIPHVAPVHFLDLGCCPGGFSDYVLKNPNAYGVGVSLQAEDGGYGFAIPFPQRQRFDLNWADLTYFKICCPLKFLDPNLNDPDIEKQRKELYRVPFDLQGFQLVMIDGQLPRPQESASTRPWDMDRLLISQLIIALEAVDCGGKIIVKLRDLESAVTARLVYMLDKISKKVIAFKPYVHATRNSVLVVAWGIGKGSEGWKRICYRDELKKVWWKLTFGGRKKQGRWLNEQDLDFIVGLEELRREYLGRLIEIGRGSWRVQSSALKRTYARIRENEAAQSSGSISPGEEWQDYQ